MSDVAIAKACRRADIPSPGVGYWAKVRHGKKVAQTPLPPPTSKTPSVIQISPGASNLLRGLAPDVQEKIANESSEEWRIAVPKTLSNLHPLLKGDQKLRDRNSPPYGYLHQAQEHHTKVERRRLRVLSALFHALEKRGHQIVANPQNPLDIDLVVDGERIEFSLSERQKQIREDLTPEELRNPTIAAFGTKSRVTLRATGILVFKIHAWIGAGVRTQWAEGARGPLENRLNEIIAGLLAAAATIRQHRLEQEEEQRRFFAERMEREKREEMRRKEAQRIQALLQQVTRWLQAVDVRAYVDAVHTAARTGRAKLDPERLEEWASWALMQADQMDPIVVGDPLTQSGSESCTSIHSTNW